MIFLFLLVGKKPSPHYLLNDLEHIIESFWTLSFPFSKM